MKHLQLILALTLITSFGYAQESTLAKKLEGDHIGARLSFNAINTGTFALLYKQKKEKGFLLWDADMNFGSSNNLNIISATAQLSVYKLKDSKINENFFISHGWGGGGRALVSKRNDQQIFSFRPHLGYRAELNYKLNERFYLGLGTTPSLSVNASLDTSNDNIEVDFGLGVNSSASLHAYYII